VIELDFNPKIGEYVELDRHDGLFEILDIQPSTTGIPGPVFTLKDLQGGRLLENVHHFYVRYPADVSVRRELEKVFAHWNSWPEDFQEGRFEVKPEKMYDDTPRIMVYFHLKPDVVPSVAKARVWNDFYTKLLERLQPIMDSGTWLQFSAREERSALSAAS
jgi:hypothetical protein